MGALGEGDLKIATGRRPTKIRRRKEDRKLQIGKLQIGNKRRLEPRALLGPGTKAAQALGGGGIKIYERRGENFGQERAAFYL